jgi:integrase
MKATVILYKTNKTSKGLLPLTLVLRDRTKIKRVSLKTFLPEKCFNEKTRRWQNLTKKADELIKTTEAKYATKISELQTMRKKVSLDTLYQMVEHPVKNDYTVLQWMEKLRDDYKAVDNIGQANIYDNARRLLDLFRNSKDIAFDEIDLPFLNKYTRFLKQRKIKDSSVSIYMRTLRAAISKAIAEGYTKEMPFDQYTIPKGQANKRALSEKEMEAILKLENRNDDYYRYLLFSYYTIGMNFTDMARLTWDDIRGNEIHYTRQKIHQKLIIPIHTKIREILDHYRPITGNIPLISGANNNYIFKILDKDDHKTEAQKENRIRKILKEFNKELKNIGASAKVETVLTSYVLRHTAITNLVRLGITADAIQALAGHKRLTTTENYIKEASQEVKSKAVNML